MINIINAKLPQYRDLQGIQINNQGIIEAIAPMNSLAQSSENQSVLDVSGDWISLGGVDLQINGALGLAFPDLEEKHLPLLSKICEFLWNQGIDGFLPTIVTTSVNNIRRSLSVIADFITNQKSQPLTTAQILGVHLEGPFLNYEKRGAHQAAYLLPLTIENVKRLLGDYGQIVKIITLAPELEPTGKVITYLKSLGITVSLGHTQATSGQGKRAFQLGASMVTHAFNAMPGLHHREPGLLGEAIINPHVYCGLIADGQHVYPSMMELLLRASNYEQGVFLVSDALAPIGLADGVYPWDSREIEVKNGTARLPDGTLAGTTLPLLTGVENLVKGKICTIEQAIALATQSPRSVIGLSGIAPGQAAQLLRWNWNESELTWERFIRNNNLL